MATFGPIASAAPNVLFDPARALGAAADLQRNQLMMEQRAEDQAFQREDRQFQIGERDHAEVARISAVLHGRPEAEQRALYPQLVGEAKQRGLLRAAPTDFPGVEVIAAKAQSGLTAAQIFARQDAERERASLGGMFGAAAPAASVPGVPGAAPAGPVTAGVPADLLPHFEEASRATGIPVPLLIAQAKQESGFRPDAVGRSGEVGIMQVMPSTAQQPGFGMQGVDPATLRDPRANIMFGAQYLAARNRGVDWNDPAQRDAGLGRYNGGGDPNYAANVTRNLPSGAPAPRPTPPGGVAARTGGTDTAGPGVPAAPSAASGLALNPPGTPEWAMGTTAEDQVRLRALAGSRGMTREKLIDEASKMAQANRLQLRWEQAHPPASPDAGPFGGTGIEAQANNILLRVGPKIANGTASDGERQQYELAHGHITRGSVQPVPDPSDPTGQRMMLGRVPGQVPGSFPAPDFRPGAPGAEPAPAATAPGVQPIAGTAKPVPVKDAPAKVADGMLENVGAVRKIDDALLELTARNGEGVGLITGNLPTAITSRTDPKGVKLRALISDIGSLKLHDRSGANVTASESPRLLPFIPMTSDDADTVRTKLQNFRREYLTALRDQYETYGPTTGHKPIAPVERLLKGAERVKVATPEEARKLPSGTPIELPDGSPGVVP